LLSEYGIEKENPLIVLHPGTSSSDSTVLQHLLGRARLLLKKRLPIDRKRWPIKYYAELANLLYKEWGVRVIITGSQHELKLAREILGRLSIKPVNLCGKMTINQLVALYKICNLVVCSDTGPLHLAAAVGTPVVGLYGGYSNPAHTGPWMEEYRFKIIRSNLKCGPCKFVKRKKICWRANCIREIKPREVFAAIKELISKHA
jgi:ADP-heptose:LPS heptosyltransferase